MEVSKSGYYEWLSMIECLRKKEDKNLKQLIKEAFVLGRKCYGVRRIQKHLEITNGITISRRRTAKLSKIWTTGI